MVRKCTKMYNEENVQGRAERDKLVQFVFIYVITTENKARDLLFLSLAFVIDGFLRKI